MQKSWLDDEDAKPPRENAHFVVSKKQAAASIFRGGDTVSEEIVFGIGINEEVSSILSSHHPKMSNVLWLRRWKRRMSIKAFCTGGGYRRDVAKRKSRIQST